MIIDFHFSNFTSFRDLQEFSLRAAAPRTGEQGMSDDNVFVRQKIRLLKSKAIYGANGSGKSNLTDAFSVFIGMVSKSVSDENLPAQVWKNRFQLVTNWDDQPIMFQLKFIVDSEIYRYGFQIVESEIAQEWLYRCVGSGSDIQLFLRAGSKLKNLDIDNFKGGELIAKQLLSKDNELFRKDSLFLTASALNGNKLAQSIRNAILKIVSVNDESETFRIKSAIDIIENDQSLTEDLVNFLKDTGTGVEGLKMQKFRGVESKKNQLSDLPNEILANDDIVLKGLFSIHSIFDENGRLVKKKPFAFGEMESQGTVKLFGLGLIFIGALSKGKTLIIDEFEARLHPNLTIKLLKLFHNKKTNPKNAQLIFVTHETDLLERANLRRDQICIVDKDRFGVSSITTLIEYKNLHKGASYGNDYLNGRYSGIPFLDNLDNILTPKNKSTIDGLQKAR
jgi:uncharacterized protein